MDIQNRKPRSKSTPVTLRLRRDLYELLPVQPAYYAGKAGAGKAGYLSDVLEEALLVRLGLATAEVDAQAA